MESAENSHFAYSIWNQEICHLFDDCFQRFLLHRPFNLTSPAAFPNPPDGSSQTFSVYLLSSIGEGAAHLQLSMIRQITDRYVGHGYDNRDLEACFDDIMKEERRSARIAREEDEMEAKLIAEEEERERQRKLLKLRRKKVSNGDQRRRLSSSCDRAVEMLFSFFYDSSCGARDYLKLRNRLCLHEQDEPGKRLFSMFLKRCERQSYAEKQVKAPYSHKVSGMPAPRQLSYWKTHEGLRAVDFYWWDIQVPVFYSTLFFNLSYHHSTLGTKCFLK
ncbi:hypothetical protein YC2023_113807 [Brassica napus]